MPSDKVFDDRDRIILANDRLPIGELIDWGQSDEGGAISTFLGTTRNNFEGKEVVSLEYEAYEDMAMDALERICKKVRSQWEVLKIGIAHKLGSCPVGDVSVCIVISSAHRREAIKAVEFCIDDLKASVPIWKKEVYGKEWLGDSSWKKNKEFAPKVPTNILPGAPPGAPATPLPTVRSEEATEEVPSGPLPPSDTVAVPTPEPLAATATATTALAGASEMEKKTILPVAAFTPPKEESQEEKDKRRREQEEKMRTEMKRKLYHQTISEVDGQKGSIILTLLDRAFDADPKIDEIGVMMLPEPEYATEEDWAEHVLAVREEHKLGVGVACMKPLFAHVMTQLSECIKLVREYEQKEEGREYDHPTKSLKESHPTVRRLLSLTRAVLVVRGDMPSALNARKMAIRLPLWTFLLNYDRVHPYFGGKESIRPNRHAACLALIEEELKLLDALFTLHPKSPSAWHHRRWCLSFREVLRAGIPRHTTQGWMDAIAKGCRVDTSGSGAHSRASSSGKKVKSNSSIVLALSAEEWQREAELCTLVNTRYPKNYYGWLHRLWLLSTAPPLGVDTYRGEVEYATDWLRKNVSDHCGVNYLEQSVQRLRAALSPADQGGLISLDVYGDALYKMKDQVEQRAGCHETLWYGVRAFACHVLDTLDEQEDSSFGKKGDGKANVRPMLAVAKALHDGAFALDGPASSEAGDMGVYPGISIADFLATMVKLVRTCRQNIDVWDFQLQRTHATRFYAYLMIRVIVRTRGIDGDNGEREARVGLADCAAEALSSLAREDAVDRHWEVLV